VTGNRQLGRERKTFLYRKRKTPPGVEWLTLILLLLFMGWMTPAWARMPVVVFQVESEGGRAAAARCHEIWMDEGPRVTSDILSPEPGYTEPDTVTCLILDTSSFQQHFQGRLPDWGVGVALPSGRVIALDYTRLPAVGRGLREVFLHEMVHALLFQGSGGAWLPAWFHEGAAMLFSGEWKFSDTVSLILDGRVPDLERLQGRFPVPHDRADRAYRTSLLAINRLREGFGEGIIADLVRESQQTGDFTQAFVNVTGQDLGDFQREFTAAMNLKFGWMLFMTRWPGLFVLAALVFAIGATRKIVINRRRMAALDDFPDDPDWPPRTDPLD
jgi:hypothetical protein